VDLLDVLFLLQKVELERVSCCAGVVKGTLLGLVQQPVQEPVEVV
jgi:hypothetical protein